MARAQDYGFEVIDFLDYIGWTKSDTALVYARCGWRGLASKMRPIKYLQSEEAPWDTGAG